MNGFQKTTGFFIIMIMVIASGLPGGCPQNPETESMLDPAASGDVQQDAPETQAGEADTGDADAGDDIDLSQPRPLEGPGFTLTIPAGFALIQDSTTYPAYSFWHYYADEFSDVAIAVGVLPASPGTTSTYENFSMRIKGAVLTAANDFLLTCRMQTDDVFGDEAEGAVGLLADDSVLVLIVGSNYFSGDDELTAQLLFQSVDLEGVDGRELERRWIETTPQIRVITDNDLIVLSDDSVWELPSTASFPEKSEFNSWRVGDHVFPQMVTEYFLDHEELVHVGNWFPIEVDFLDFATESTIAGFLDEWTITLSDGSSWDFNSLIPAGWNVGDSVFFVDDQYLGEWLIHEKTSLAIMFY